MPQWLVVNPNTSETVTQALVHHLSVDTPRRRWHGVTAAFGAPYIADERSYCIAGHAVLDAWERAQAAAPPQGYAGVLVGCFGDPGLEALRSTTPVPVRGLAEASLQALWVQGPQRIAKPAGGQAGTEEPLHAGMILSNEPGYYKAGHFGIRDLGRPADAWLRSSGWAKARRMSLVIGPSGAIGSRDR